MDTTQYTTAPVPILLKRYSTILPQYHWGTSGFWRINKTDSPTVTQQSAVDQVIVLFIRHSTLLSQYQSFL